MGKREKKPTAAAAEAAAEAEMKAKAKQKRKPNAAPKPTATNAKSRPPIVLKLKRKTAGPEDPVQAQQDALDEEDEAIESASSEEDVDIVEDSEADEKPKSVVKQAVENGLRQYQAKQKQKAKQKATIIDTDLEELPTPPPTQATSKRRAKATIEVIDSDEETRRKDEKNRRLEEELSQIDYTVHWEAYFEEAILRQDTTVHSISGYSRFDFFMVDTKIRLLMQEHAASNSLTCHHIDSKALFKWSKQTNEEKAATITTLDTTWDYDSKVVPQLRMKMTQKPPKKQPTVHITIRYHRSADGIIPESQRPPPVEKPKTMTQLKALEKEQKMKQQGEEKKRRMEQADDKRLRIMVEYNCIEPKCSNYSQGESVGGRCVIHGDVHYKLTDEAIRQWLDLIAEGKYTTASCPSHIRKTLKRQVMTGSRPHGGEKKQEREQNKEETPLQQLVTVMVADRLDKTSKRRHRYKHDSSSNSDSASKSSSSCTSSTPANRKKKSKSKHKRRYSDSEEERKSKRKFGHKSSKSSSKSKHSTTTSNTRQRAYSNLPDAPPPSSPVTLKGSAVEAVDDFINWLIDENLKVMKLEEREAFLDAGRILNRHGFDLQTIQPKKNSIVAEEWWAHYGIKPGIGTRLARYAKEYETWARRGGYTDILTPITEANMVKPRVKESFSTLGMRRLSMSSPPPSAQETLPRRPPPQQNARAPRTPFIQYETPSYRAPIRRIPTQELLPDSLMESGPLPPPPPRWSSRRPSFSPLSPPSTWNTQGMTQDNMTYIREEDIPILANSTKDQGYEENRQESEATTTDGEE